MSARKKFFPKNSAPSLPRGRGRSRTMKSYNNSHGNGKCLNLRNEFDKLMSDSRTLMSDDQLRQHWATISARILEYPLASLQEHIDSLHI